MKKGIAVTSISAYVFISALVYYIISAVESYYDDGFGVSIAYGNKDILMICIMSLFVIALGILYIYEAKKSVKYSYVTNLVISLDGALGFFYFLAMAIKKSIKGETNSVYYVLAGLGLLVLLAGAFFLLEERKANISKPTK